MKKNLRSGYTTGACAAAASKGAAFLLLKQALISEVSIDLPTGEIASFQLHGQSFSADKSSCFVVKDAGDDPDVTNGVEVWAKVTPLPFDATLKTIQITGGIGIGRVTKPGLAIPPGEPAINPVPRRMIELAVDAVISECKIRDSNFEIEISIPDGEERAKKTLNARLGIIGGLSILGTTGVVRPISVKAWTDTIDAALDVAKACGCKNVVLSTGRSSEMATQQHFSNFPEEAYIMMGDHVGYALKACLKRGFVKPIIACQFAKMLKIACGHENTHAAASDLDLTVLHGWVETADLPKKYLEIIMQANTAREIAVATGFNKAVTDLVAKHAVKAAALHAPGIMVQPILCGYNGTVVTFTTNPLCNAPVGEGAKRPTI